MKIWGVKRWGDEEMERWRGGEIGHVVDNEICMNAVLEP